MSKHTPGPWEWRVSSSMWSVALIAPHSGQLTVMDFVRWGMDRAQPRFSDRDGSRKGGLMHKASLIDVSAHPDARLIAAAPDMLEALRAAELLAWECGTETDDGVATILEDSRGDLWRQITAAIAKATEEPSK